MSSADPSPSASRLATLWQPMLADGDAASAARTGATFHGALAVDDARPDRRTAHLVVESLRERATAIATVVAPPTPDAPVPARSADRTYELLGEVGRGGMAVVYRARQAALCREVALKTAHGSPLGGSDEKFVAEALVTAGLEHPNIVPVYDLTTTEGSRLALAMKLVGGSTWEHELAAIADSPRRRKEDLDTHLDILLAVANAIAFAHAHGIVHCDIKPENVLLGAYGEVLVVDWGIALDYRDPPGPDAIAPPRAALRSPCGTPAYIAPELALAETAEIGPATDVYLLGATLYQIATGRAPRDGLPVLEALVDAAGAEGPTFRDADAVNERLKAIIAKAMARAPAARYPDVHALQEAIRDFRRHRDSLELGEAAEAALAAARARALRVPSQAERNRLYGAFADAVAGFRQALVLWPDNVAARRGEDAARLHFATAALDNGDLSLAETQAEAVLELRADHAASPEHVDAARRLLERLGALRRLQERARRVGVRLKWTLGAAVAVIVVGLVVGATLVMAEKERALASQGLAESRLAAIRQLSDVKHLDDLEAAADALWPAEPDKAPALERWLDDARALVLRLPEHRRALAALRAAAGTAPDGVATLPTIAEQWEHDTLAALVAGIVRLLERRVPDVEARLGAARTLQQRSIDDARAAWDRAIAAVAASPRYGGLRLTPQLGLVPLGPDPRSGLEEFAHLPTGEPAVRDASGALVIGEATGVVLVLVPGGTFTMGARPPDAAHPLGSPNVDPAASAHEGPPHEVTLAPYFIGKHEVTQAQWRRVMGTEPSAYLPGRTIGGRVVTTLHPVEQVGHAEAARWAARVGLALPTEAQWERMARGDTTTPFWTGEAPESLAGTLNIADEYCRTHEGPGSWRYETWLDDGYTSHAPIGSYRPNPFGLHDVNGNVWEWCADAYAPYTSATRPGDGFREGLPGAPHVFRGGGLRANASHARSADRYSLYGTEHRGFDLGLRAARSLHVSP